MHPVPCWQVQGFLNFASGYRRRRSLVDPDMRGQSKSVLVLFVAFLGKHVLPTLYPKWADVHQGGMGKGQLRAFVNDLHRFVSNLFTEAGAERLAELAKEEAVRASLRVGASQEEAAAAGVAAGAEVTMHRRMQTAKSMTKEHASEQDLCLVRDVLATEALRPMRALVADGYVAYLE